MYIYTSRNTSQLATEAWIPPISWAAKKSSMYWNNTICLDILLTSELKPQNIYAIEISKSFPYWKWYCIYGDCLLHSVSFHWHYEVLTDMYCKIIYIFWHQNNFMYYKLICIHGLFLHTHVHMHMYTKTCIKLKMQWVLGRNNLLTQNEKE